MVEPDCVFPSGFHFPAERVERHVCDGPTHRPLSTFSTSEITRSRATASIRASTSSRLSSAGLALGEVELNPDLLHEVPNYRMHPVLLDGCLQVLSAALADATEPRLYLPVGMASITVHGTGATHCVAHATVRPGNDASRRADIRVVKGSGQEVLDRAALETLRRLAVDS